MISRYAATLTLDWSLSMQTAIQRNKYLPRDRQTHRQENKKTETENKIIENI